MTWLFWLATYSAVPPSYKQEKEVDYLLHINLNIYKQLGNTTVDITNTAMNNVWMFCIQMYTGKLLHNFLSWSETPEGEAGVEMKEGTRNMRPTHPNISVTYTAPGAPNCTSYVFVCHVWWLMGQVTDE